MKVPDKHFVIAKAKKYLNEDIGPSRYVQSIAIDGWQYAEYDADDAPHGLAGYAAIPESDFKPIASQDRWGGYDRTAWFKTIVELPDGFSTPGTKPGFSLLNKLSSESWGTTNVECLLYVNGKAVQGLDHRHTEALLEESLLTEGSLEIVMKVWAGLSKDKTRLFPDTSLIKIHSQTDEFYFTALALADSVELLGEHDLRRFKLTKLLQETFTHINFLNPKSKEYYESIKTALAFMAQGLSLLRRPEVKPVIHAVGHSHIDMAWLWRLSATREKASRTFATVLNLMAQFPEYYFTHSSPQLYKFLAEDYPEIYDRIKEKMQTGQWEATGGMWVESDTNIPGGESLVRQFLFGKRYFKEVLGVDTTVLWLPDVFGYSAALPQIAKKSGIDYFMTTKISWNQYNHFPYDTFNWRGLDGTEILTHFVTTPTGHRRYYTYNGALTPQDIPGIWENYKQKDINEHLLLSYGYGDGGGGPTREMLMTRRAMEDIPGIPYVKTNKAEQYFKALGQSLDGKNLETYDGELYFEYHRGTYTSQAYNKKANRQMENLLHNAELLSMVRDLKQGISQYPAGPLNEIWERVLLLQFHDIIPGTSIRQVYEDSRKDYENLLSRTDAIIAETTSAINSEIKLNQDSVVVYNHLSWKRDTAEVFVPFSDRVTGDTIFTDSEGYTLESQKVEGGLHVVFTELPPMGYKTFAISTLSPDAQEEKEDDEANFKLENNEGIITLETNFYNVEFNQNGEITSLYDKLAMRQICKGSLNMLEAFEDKPLAWDAWDTDVFYKEKPYNCFTYSGLEVAEQGELRTILRRKIKFNNSEIEQDIIFYARNRRIDFKTKAEWNERQVLLKAAFPLDIRATNAAYDIQFGFVERANHSSDEIDFAQFEVCGHKWADVSESGYGAALFNDCKYGYDCKDSVLRLTLLKSPTYPDETADIGTHEFTYALYPHLGNLVGSYVQTRAAEFNSPVNCCEVPGNDEGSYFVEFSLLKVDAQTPQLMDEDPSLHIVVDTVKKSEDGKDLILRVYESNNRALNDAVIQMDSCVRFAEVVETNLMEEPLAEQNVKVDGQSIVFDIKPFEIKTFRLKL